MSKSEHRVRGFAPEPPRSPERRAADGPSLRLVRFMIQGPGPGWVTRFKILGRTSLSAVALASLLLGTAPALATSPEFAGAEAYRALGIEPGSVLSGTVLQARTMPGEPKQGVVVVSYFTGSKREEDAVNVRLAVLEPSAGTLVPLYERDLGAEQKGRVANGDLQVVDLDLDGVNEIIVSWDSFADPLVEQRLGEVIVHGPDGFRTAWSGALEYDATRAARDLPRERRDRWQREVDVPATLKSRGATLVFERRVLAVAGERLEPPKVVRETFPLRDAGR